MFDPQGYDVEGWTSHPPYAPWREHMNEEQFNTPFIVYHPQFGHGERRSQLVQNVDVYPTVLAALGKPIPEKRQGVNLIPVLQDKNASTRNYAIMGQFGYSISITDGEWTLHQAPNPDKPLYWYSYHLSRFYRRMELGPFVAGRRRVLALHPPMPRGCLTTWLTNKREDPAELVNLAEQYPDKVREMQCALKQKLYECEVPYELVDRFRLSDV